MRILATDEANLFVDEFFLFQFKVLKVLVINAQNENKITFQEMYPASTQPLTNITNEHVVLTQPLTSITNEHGACSKTVMPSKVLGDMPIKHSIESQIQSSQGTRSASVPPSLGEASIRQPVATQIQSCQASTSRAESVPPIRTSRDLPNNFEFPSAKLSPFTFRAINDPLSKLKPIELKEVINVLFTEMFEITGLYPSSSQYLLGVDSILRKYRHLEVINGKSGRVRNLNINSH